SNASAPVGAFIYPHGTLTTFEVAYGPSRWYLKQPFETSNKTVTKLLRTTTHQLPITKWNFTWYYTESTKTKLSTTTSTITTTTTTTTTTKKPITISMTTTQSTIIVVTSKPRFMTKTPTVTANRRLLFTYTPWIYYSFRRSQLSSTTTTTRAPTVTTIVTKLTSIVTTTMPYPTPLYPRDGSFDFFRQQWLTTKSKSSFINMYSTTQTTSTTRQIPTTSTTVTTITTT
ncbi:unnamed protein product, partial [Adineta steineri]